MSELGTIVENIGICFLFGVSTTICRETLRVSICKCVCVRCVTVRKIFGRLYAQTREDLRNFKQKMPWNLDKSCVRMCKINLRNFNKCWNGLKHFSKTSNKFFLGKYVSLACHWYMIKHMYRYIYLVCQWIKTVISGMLPFFSLSRSAEGCRVFKGTDPFPSPRRSLSPWSWNEGLDGPVPERTSFVHFSILFSPLDCERWQIKTPYFRSGSLWSVFVWLVLLQWRGFYHVVWYSHLMSLVTVVIGSQLIGS